MSFFSFFKKSSKQQMNVHEEILSYIEKYKKDFLLEYPYYAEDDACIEIFDKSKSIVRTIRQNFLLRELKKQSLSFEEFALNAIQNIAMRTIMEGNVRELLTFGGTRTADNVYVFINQCKLDNHYISQKQFDENEKLLSHIHAQLALRY